MIYDTSNNFFSQFCSVTSFEVPKKFLVLGLLESEIFKAINLP